MNTPYTIEVATEEFWPGDVITLRDQGAGSWAKILPTQGCNLVAFGATLRGQAIETFLQPSDEAPARSPSQYGAPVLFPFPNRLRGGRARFGGKVIQIDRPPGQPHAIHGLVSHQSWQVDRQTTDATGAQVTCSIVAGPDTLRQFPFPYRLSLGFRLSGACLRVEVEAENLGDTPMPMGFGWHPYFRLPLISGGSRSDAIVQVPARRLWALEETLVPTGEIIPPPAGWDFHTPRAFGSVSLDDVYTDLILDNGQSACTLADPGTGATLRIAAGPTFREWVVYAPLTRPTICFEPYTCPTDAFNLQERGLSVGVITLDPDERWSDWMELAVGSPD